MNCPHCHKPISRSDAARAIRGEASGDNLARHYERCRQLVRELRAHPPDPEDDHVITTAFWHGANNHNPPESSERSLLAYAWRAGRQWAEQQEKGKS